MARRLWTTPVILGQVTRVSTRARDETIPGRDPVADERSHRETLPAQRRAVEFSPTHEKAVDEQRPVVIRVLVIDPENQAALSVAEALEGQKMKPTIVRDVDEGLRQLDQNPPHVVVLAASSGDQKTEDLCRAVCERTLAPLLVVGRQAHDGAVERVLAAGADAHVLEPCSKEVLSAQLWALLRRVGIVSESSVE